MSEQLVQLEKKGGSNVKYQSGNTGSSMTGVVTFDKSFSDANYDLVLMSTNSNKDIGWRIDILTKTNTGFTFNAYYTPAGGAGWTGYNAQFEWLAVSHN